jgi:hypothetical protein
MKRSYWLHLLLGGSLVIGQATVSHGQTASSAPALPVSLLVQSPADTKTDLQIFCLFRSSPVNTLHGSLIETNEKLHGLLDQIRKPGLFNGDLGETILLTPPEGTLTAKKVLIIGLGDSATFTPERMYQVGKIALREANRLGIAHPIFAPTVLDGGVTKYTTGQVAEQVVHGFRDALATEAILKSGNATDSVSVVDFSYLAGTKFAKDTQSGIDKALSNATSTVH